MPSLIVLVLPTTFIVMKSIVLLFKSYTAIEMPDKVEKALTGKPSIDTNY